MLCFESQIYNFYAGDYKAIYLPRPLCWVELVRYKEGEKEFKP